MSNAICVGKNAIKEKKAEKQKQGKPTGSHICSRD